MLMALLFFVLETTSLVLDQIGGNQLGFLLASFILSIIGFLTSSYSIAVSRSDLENDRNVIEIVFSVVQLIITYIYLSLAYLKVIFKSNIASIFPLVLAVTAIALAYKHNELVQDPTPSQPQPSSTDTSDGVYQERDVEHGVPENHNVVPSDNPSGVTYPVTNSLNVVNGEETAAPTRFKKEEIPETSRALLISSGTTMMSGDEDIIDSKAPTTPATSSKTRLFSKLIATTDLEKELIVPNGAVENFRIPEGQDFVDFLVKDVTGDIWKFCLTIKPTPVLTEGWLEFVQAKGVVQEDIVTFYKQQNEDLEEQYRVEVNRQPIQVIG
ncbi:hypothetical protein Dsin_018344 [Dipteronia sinensis]|uniref:TF-B3 domain-containing protein n=1 Tax=Dipteronia sinensis TaxID=43782 RepID=A0AAE0E1U6_9ROSI|nr:hypothetical protein Dsin_018344 [Dipteronia sinensis]